MTLDDIRAAYPPLGFAIYALEPGGDVILEVHSPEALFTFTGPTTQAVLDAAFPPEPIEAPPPANAFD
jgi:hypothetical protein